MEIKNQYTKLGKNLPCDNCGKERYFKLHEILQYKNHFCSSECRNIWLGRNKELNLKRGICKICGTGFTYPKSHYRERSTCSNRCKGVLSNVIQSKKKGKNKLEMRGSKILESMGIEFQEQFLIENKFLVDIYIPMNRLVIQWDGRYWHSKPKRRALDKSQDSYMGKCGYKVIRFTDYDVYNKESMIKEKIYEILSN